MTDKSAIGGTELRSKSGAIDRALSLLHQARMRAAMSGPATAYATTVHRPNTKTMILASLTLHPARQVYH
jgi:hypothetical protein